MSSDGEANVRLLLTEVQAAAALGVSERKFASLRKLPWFPKPVFLGPRTLRWSVEELRKAVADMPREAASRAEPSELAEARSLRRARA